MIDEQNRLAFEAWYINHLNESTGKNYSPDDMKTQLREGDGYPKGDNFSYLRGCWEGWKAATCKKQNPLSDKQLKEIAEEFFLIANNSVVAFAREIEKAHGIGL